MFTSDLPPKEFREFSLDRRSWLCSGSVSVCAGDISLGTASGPGSEDKPTLQGKPAQT